MTAMTRYQLQILNLDAMARYQLQILTIITLSMVSDNLPIIFLHVGLYIFTAKFKFFLSQESEFYPFFNGISIRWIKLHPCFCIVTCDVHAFQESDKMIFLTEVS